MSGSIGGATEVEVKERKDRVDETMHAALAAAEEGILPGGGVALLRSTKRLPAYSPRMPFVYRDSWRCVGSRCQGRDPIMKTGRELRQDAEKQLA